VAYTTRAKLETQFGAVNIEKWADLDGDGSEATIDARITAAIAYADGEIDDRLRPSPYTVPVVLTAGTGTPPTIIDIANRLAMLWLYETRGMQEIDGDTGRPLHKMHWHREEVERQFTAILSTKIRLDSPMSAASVPKAITT